MATALASCSSGGGDTSMWDAVPIVNGSENNPVEDITDLVSRAELVVVGRVTDVDVTASKPTAAAGDVAPEFLLVDLKTTVYVTPEGSKDAIAVSISSSVASDLADATVKAIEDAPLPKATTVFVLSGPADDWGYFCTSAQAYWCPLEAVGNKLRAPRASDWDKRLAEDSVSSKGDPITAIIETARAHGVEVKGS
ncbi:MAG: hypothetical protein QM618_00755 [Demequina sp.]